MVPLKDKLWIHPKSIKPSPGPPPSIPSTLRSLLAKNSVDYKQPVQVNDVYLEERNELQIMDWNKKPIKRICKMGSKA